jgi:hypothetical protein
MFTRFMRTCKKVYLPELLESSISAKMHDFKNVIIDVISSVLWYE